MAKNSNSGRRRSMSSIMNFLSYVAVIFVGIALLISLILDWTNSSSDVANAFQLIATILSYIVIGVLSFYYARTKRNVWFLVAWAIAIVLILLFFVFQVI